MTLDEVMRILEGKEKEFTRRADYANFGNADTEYYEGLRDAYGIALNLVKGMKND